MTVIPDVKSESECSGMALHYQKNRGSKQVSHLNTYIVKRKTNIADH